MKAVLEFDLKDEDDKQMFDRSIKASSVLHFVSEFDQKLRELYKYNDQINTTWEEVRELWYQMAQDCEVSFD